LQSIRLDGRKHFVKAEGGSDEPCENSGQTGIPAAALHCGKSKVVRTRTLAISKQQK
jgi:hypothetical protein